MKSVKYPRLARAIAQALGVRSTALGCATLFATCGVAVAQDDQAEQPIEEVVVTGFRASLETSIGEKREADLIVEAISAEDIGKLPDISIAESIARVPGLTTQRLDGRAQVISIRGLAPDFSTTLLNGREQVTTGDNRSAEYDQYPSELVSAVLVYKTPDAALIGQGLSGTVDLQTVRPLKYGRRTIAANLRGETLSLGDLNAGSEEDGYRVSGSYIDQFADDRVGIAIGAAYLDSPTQVERFNSWGYPEAAPGGPAVMGGAKPYVVSTELKRTGVIGTLEFAPAETFTTAVDVYYSKFEDEQLLRGIELPLLWGGAQLDPNFQSQGGLVNQGTYSNVKAVVRNDANLREAELWSAGWNAQLDAGAWQFIGDLSFSQVDREDVILETYSGTGRAGVGATDTMDFVQSDEGDARFTSILDYSDPNLIMLTSPQGWGGNAVQGGQDGFINNPSIDDELTALRLSAARELQGFMRGLDFGANYTLRDKSYSPDRFYLGLVANTDGNTSVAIPAGALLRPTELEFLGIPAMVSYDPLAIAYGGMYNFVPAVDANVFSREWAIEENVLTGYAQLNLETEWGSSELHGSIGVQVVQTDQTSDGVGASNVPGAPFGTPAVVTPVSVKQDYTETLPSLNLSLRMPGDYIARLGLGRQMARARLDDMRPSLEFTYNANLAGSTDINNSPWGGQGGNPTLRPWIANAADLSLEKYFGREGYVSGAVFYKDLRSYIYNAAQLYDFTDFPVTSGPEPVLQQGFVTVPQNGTGGEIYGYEIGGALPFGTLVSALDGFGVIGSYSYTKSDISDPNNPSRPLPGLSEDVVAGTVYYEKYGFSARASVRHRSAFLGEVQGVGAERLLRSARAETLIDAQMSYDFQVGNLQGLSVLLQGYNLTDEPFVTTELNNNHLVIDHQTFGRRYLLGVSFKY
jgi:iron complex outermembrane receptor protein